MREGPPLEVTGTEALPDLAQVKGQEAPKRALEVSAAGGHPILLTGPAGAGKTILARCLPSLLPPLAEAEAAEIAERYRRAGLDPPLGRPLRTPPSTLRLSGLAGGRRPGEAALATGGVLLLDDLPAFGRRSLRALRELLAGRSPGVGQGAGAGSAKFLLVATMRPCPCGASGDEIHPCSCTRWRLDRYTAPVRELFLDLAHLHVEVPLITTAELTCRRGESSREVAARVSAARRRQQARNPDDGTLNAHLRPSAISKSCEPDRNGRNLLDTAFDRLRFTFRDAEIILRVARTIGDLAGSETVGAPHVAEAIQYRTSSWGLRASQ